jgi:hypothetical protein
MQACICSNTGSEYYVTVFVGHEVYIVAYNFAMTDLSEKLEDTKMVIFLLCEYLYYGGHQTILIDKRNTSITGRVPHVELELFLFRSTREVFNLYFSVWCLSLCPFLSRKSNNYMHVCMYDVD